ncbi:hypothetical protein AYY22_19700 [Photobacterium kishitanii]|uniref:hypothetical protein n=1 Tax=Photobacterium kishitanii TaxID=318456 RepID=UPI0007EFFEAE|nr:hypothetical protein [Photobacterium kishitanii]OBU25881.1 hypothetical protein AYY22_19700 [Photobacterium kishitanii]
MVDRINHRKLIGINKTDIIGVLTSGFGASLVKEHYPTAKIHQFKTKLDILHALANGEINYAVISLSAAHVLLQKKLFRSI